MTTVDKSGGLRECECGEWTYAAECGRPCRQPAPVQVPAEAVAAPAEPETAGPFRYAVVPIGQGWSR